jgi:hypothetical protein
VVDLATREPRELRSVKSLDTLARSLWAVGGSHWRHAFLLPE